MRSFASFFTKKGVLLLQRYSTTSIGYRLMVEERGDRMVVVKAEGGRQQVLVKSLDAEALEAIKREHLLHEEDPQTPGAEILLHHTVEEVVACIDGEYWAVERAADRVAKAGAVNWRARYEAIFDLWGAGARARVTPADRRERIKRCLVDRGMRRMLRLNFPAPWAVRLVGANWDRLIVPPFCGRQPDPSDRDYAESRVAYAARAVLERTAEEQGIALSRMLTLALVDHVVTGRLNIGQALNTARRATFDQLLGYEPVTVEGFSCRH